MNFTPHKKSISLNKHEQFSYDHDLQLYRQIPDMNINLDEFEEWAIERLKGKKISYLVRLTILLSSTKCNESKITKQTHFYFV